MFKKHILWIVTIVLFQCSQQVSSEDDSDKTKREVWSSGKLNSFSDDKNDKSFGPMSPFAQVFSAIDSLGLKMNGNVKSTVEFWPPDMDKEKFYKLRQEESSFPLTSWFNFKPLVKEAKEPEISYPIVVKNNDDNLKISHDLAESTVKQSNKDTYSTKSLKDYTTNPDVIRIPQKYFKHERYTVKPEIHDIEYDQKYILSTAKPEVIDSLKYDVKYYKSTIKRPEIVHQFGFEQNNFKGIEKPFISSVEYENALASPAPLNDHHSITTEQTVNFDDAMTNVGPVVFPANSGLTEEKRTHEFITFVPTTAASPRANKKRKLKKKVKTSSITQLNMEKYITQAPPTALVVNSSIDVIAETSSDYTPVNGFIDHHDSIQYTDIISNLSNLTEMSFNSFNGTGNNHHQFKQQSDHQKSIKNNIYSSKKMIHSTTPYSFIIKVEPEKVAETQDDVIENVKIKNQVTLSSTPSLPQHDMKKLESPKMDSSKKAAEKKILKQKVTDEMSSKFKIVVENSSNSQTVSTISNSIDEKYFTTTVSTAKKLQRSRFGIRNFKPRVQSEAVRNQASSTASSVASSSSSSTTVKSIPKRIKSSINTVSSTQKPINDSMMIVKSTARYYTPKSRTRHQNSRIKQSTTKSSSTLSTIKTKIRRTTKKSSKN